MTCSVFYCWYLTLRCDLDLWPWTFIVYWLWRDQRLYQISSKSISLQRSSIMTSNICHMPCDALDWDNFKQGWTWSTYPFLTYNVFTARQNRWQTFDNFCEAQLPLSSSPFPTYSFSSSQPNYQCHITNSYCRDDVCQGSLSHSRLFTVTHFDTNQKSVCDFKGN